MEIRTCFRAVALGFSIAACSIAANALPSPGVYSFSGNCTDCEISAATAVLNVPTNSISAASFTFSSSNFPGGLISEWIEVANLGPINASGNADAWINFGAGGNTYDFRSDTSGDWMLSQLNLSRDEGNQGVWSARPVPEPSTYALWLLGAGLLASARVRRSKT